MDLRHDGDRQHTRADIAIKHQLERAFELILPEAVYHLAAEFGRHNGEDFTEQLWRTGMVGTRNVLELCRDYGSHLVFGSSSEVYGEAQADTLYEGLTDERVILHPNEYALSKWANEQQIRAFAQREPDLKWTILRFFNAYGPGEAYHPYRSVVSLFCHKALNGEPLPVYEGYYRTFMAVQDFIPTLANVCEADLKWRVYNIGGTDYRSVEELAEIICDQTWKIPVKSAIDLIPEDKHNTRNKRPDISRAREDLGHDPKIRLEEGVPLTLDWMKNGRDVPIPVS